MIHFSSNCTHHTNLHSTFAPRFFLKHAFQIREFRVYRRRRLKLAPRNQLGIGNGNHFHDFISQFPSPNSLQLIAPLLGFVSGATLYLSNSNSNSGSAKQQSGSDIGEWVLFTSPTPFNRFVLLRHFVRLNSGRIQFDSRNRIDSGVEEKLEYQRLCVGTDDGGVISLDWPANLDLKEEHGLDTTLVIVPGSALGSMDWKVRSFVCEALRRGCFPIVMNPRGCAGSPLTTPRLFSAADSDDISTAIQFITEARPWTTLMGVGWGYGANMLTKYLAEVGRARRLQPPPALTILLT
ncbi:hypothetical protein Pyn_06032 [Prunus yedoensis var. nudiflora]|uniref:Embryogenesis-associated protein EMB8 n=1 Tax=Prunus yedoensis var. nudiflora TaxID=2094558 RepID=A0A314Z835_PRUYE|nr:hypothetical protein Pyn_06032 [Prunus yedoensis var. nudiflora]